MLFYESQIESRVKENSTQRLVSGFQAIRTKRCKSLIRRKFTLIELLITISIIAILAAMLLPVLNSARDKGKLAKCLNNEKQLGLAFGMYTSDYDGHFPLNYQDAPPLGKWTYSLVHNKYASGKIFLCDKKNSSYNNKYLWTDGVGDNYSGSSDHWSLPDYGYNFMFIGDVRTSESALSTKTSAKMSSLRKPSETICVAESASYHVTKPHLGRSAGAYYIYPYYHSSVGVAWPTHDGICNVLWTDGHASGVKVSGGATENGCRNLYYTSALGSSRSGQNASLNLWKN